MKKFLKFFFLFILFILIVLFTAPFLFKGKIIKVANEQISNNINANVKFDDIKLSFFKQFPYLSASIKNLSVVGIDEFAGDTLMSVKSINVAVNVLSAIKMENVEIRKITIVSPRINAIVLESGKANWDIAKETPDEEVPTEDTTEFSAKIALKLFRISNAEISYKDMKEDMEARLNNFNFDLKGDMAQDYSTLVIDSKTDKLNFLMSGIKYMKDVALNMHIDIDANLKDMIFVLQQNSISLNEFMLKVDGSVEMPDSADMMFDLKYQTSNTEFKTLLSLIPAIYMSDFNDIKTSGKLALNGTVKGALGDSVTPDVKGKLLVENAMFSYPDLPKNADKINIDVDYFYDGKQMDNTTVDINKFHVEFGGNPVDLTLNLKTPISDPFINSQINADLDLATFTDIIPLEKTEIRGKIFAKLDLMGNMSVIEKEQYEDFKAAGNINITDFYYNSPDVPKPFSIEIADLIFSPKFVQVVSFKSKMGKSDFALSGKVTDFLSYVFDDGTIRGKFDFTAGTIDLNEFMSEETTETSTEATDTATLEPVEVPGNIDFTLTSSIGNLYYEKLVMKNVSGTIYIKESRLILEKLSMNTLDGSMVVSGEYNSQDIKNPLVDFDFQANSIDIPMAFTAFGVLGKIAPIASKATGKITLGMKFNSFLDHQMKPILKTIMGAGNLASKQIGIKGSNSFTAISSQLNTDAFKEMVLNDLDVDYEIRSGRLFVNPFETKMGSTLLTIAGEQGFDNTLDYGINISAPKSLFGTSNATLNGLYSKAAIPGFDFAASETVNLLVKVTGAMTKPQIKIDAKASAKQATEAIKEELKQNVQQVVETKKEDVKEKARAEADKLMKEAENQATEIRKQGKIAADKIRAESTANADKLIKQAKNPIEKKAAELSAKKMKEEGEKRALQVEKESDTKAQKILTDAKAKSDQMLK